MPPEAESSPMSDVFSSGLDAGMIGFFGGGIPDWQMRGRGAPKKYLSHMYPMRLILFRYTRAIVYIY